MTQALPIPGAVEPRADSAGLRGPVPYDWDHPLTPEHHAQIARARAQRKKVDRALKVAAFNAWSFSVFAGLSLLFAVLSLNALIAAIALAGLAYNEFRGRRRLQRLDPRGPQTLGFNQVVCCALIAVYCGVRLVDTQTGPGVYAQAIEQSPELASALAPMEGLITTATLITYALVLVVGVTVQGATAWYYFSRRRWLNDYLQQTPAWVLDLDRARASDAP